MGLKFVVEKVVLFIGTPSTMKSGWLDPLMVRRPRIWIADPAPGSPDVCWTCTLGALPASAWTTFDSFDLTMSSGETELRTLPSFSTSVEVPAPVMTTSPSCSGFDSRSKSCTRSPPLSVMRAVFGLYPTRRAEMVTVWPTTRPPGTRSE